MNGTYLRFIQFLGGNLDLVPKLSNLVEHRQTVSGIEARWGVDKEIGDLIVPRIAGALPAEFTAQAVDGETIDSSVVQHAEAALLETMNKSSAMNNIQWDGTRLMAIFNAVLPLIQLFAK